MSRGAAGRRCCCGPGTGSLMSGSPRMRCLMQRCARGGRASRRTDRLAKLGRVRAGRSQHGYSVRQEDLKSRCEPSDSSTLHSEVSLMSSTSASPTSVVGTPSSRRTSTPDQRGLCSSRQRRPRRRSAVTADHGARTYSGGRRRAVGLAQPSEHPGLREQREPVRHAPVLNDPTVDDACLVEHHDVDPST